LTLLDLHRHCIFQHRQQQQQHWLQQQGWLYCPSPPRLRQQYWPLVLRPPLPPPLLLLLLRAPQLQKMCSSFCWTGAHCSLQSLLLLLLMRFLPLL
jgi:hypothetical protein